MTSSEAVSRDRLVVCNRRTYRARYARVSHSPVHATAVVAPRIDRYAGPVRGLGWPTAIAGTADHGRRGSTPGKIELAAMLPKPRSTTTTAQKYMKSISKSKAKNRTAAVYQGRGRGQYVLGRFMSRRGTVGGAP